MKLKDYLSVILKLLPVKGLNFSSSFSKDSLLLSSFISVLDASRASAALESKTSFPCLLELLLDPASVVAPAGYCSFCIGGQSLIGIDAAAFPSNRLAAPVNEVNSCITGCSCSSFDFVGCFERERGCSLSSSMRSLSTNLSRSWQSRGGAKMMALLQQHQCNIFCCCALSW